MAKLNRTQIQTAARQILSSGTEARWGEMLDRIHASAPETPRNSIVGGLTDLFRKDPSILKVARGTYLLATTVTASDEDHRDVRSATAPFGPPDESSVDGLRPSEAEFYDSFAEYLRDELEEVNQAIALGGSSFGGKWGTPDVIGVRKPNADDLIQFERQIVVAEIKVEAKEAITAFGQAVAYRLFAHKSFIVMPSTISKADLDPLTALCSIYGLGFVTFEPDVEKPRYNLRVSAQRSQPDMYYVNEMARSFSGKDARRFRTVF